MLYQNGRFEFFELIECFSYDHKLTLYCALCFAVAVVFTEPSDFFREILYQLNRHDNIRKIL